MERACLPPNILDLCPTGYFELYNVTHMHCSLLLFLLIGHWKLGTRLIN